MESSGAFRKQSGRTPVKKHPGLNWTRRNLQPPKRITNHLTQTNTYGAYSFAWSLFVWSYQLIMGFGNGIALWHWKKLHVWNKVQYFFCSRRTLCVLLLHCWVSDCVSVIKWMECLFRGKKKRRAWLKLILHLDAQMGERYTTLTGQARWRVSGKY